MLSRLILLAATVVPLNARASEPNPEPPTTNSRAFSLDGDWQFADAARNAVRVAPGDKVGGSRVTLAFGEILQLDIA